jgi:hypothetical protein
MAKPIQLEPSLESGPLTLAELRERVARLPAERRGAIAWSIPTVEKALERLLSEPLEAPLVEECCFAVVRATTSLAPALAQTAPPSDFVRINEEILEQHRGLIGQSLPSEAAQIADWALQLYTAVLRAVSRQLPANDGAGQVPADDALLRALHEPFTGPFFRLQTLLYAVLHAVEPSRKRDDFTRARAAALSELAGRQAASLMDDAVAVGLQLEIFAAEPAHLRIRILKELAEHLRATLSEEDRRILQGARLRDLR